MYLKGLDLQGFKSFPEKVKLEFDTGITAVVGPNGSGKSNVSDAVRWVLGEQRAKSLRGDKMEDIIFAGTENRKPLGLAEVSITLDNQDHQIPIDFTEVTVTRRVFRSGESEYLINGTGCRLKDIHELFMDTGIGREGYSIIGQGRIDELLSAKGEDRRRVFEEATGIVKYKSRKNEALLKLEREQQNLMRVEDIITELAGQLEPLQRQSEKAKQYILLHEKLKKAEISVFCTDVDRMEAELQSLRDGQSIVVENLTKTTTDSKGQKEEIVALRQKGEECSEEIQRANEEIISMRTEVEKKEGEVRLTQEQIQHDQSNIERLRAEISEKQKKAEKNRKEERIFESKITAIDVSMSEDKEKLEDLEQCLQDMSKNLDENEVQMEQYKTEMIEQIKISTETKGDIAKRETMKEQFCQRQEQLEQEKAYLFSRVQHEKTHLQVLEKQEKETQEGIAQLEQELEVLEQEKNHILEKKQGLDQERKAKEKEWSNQCSRFSVLSEMEQEHEGFFKSVKSVLKLKNSGKTHWQGICGAVGELLQVEEAYESAIEAALGGALQNIITKTEEDAKEAIDYLKNNHLGRATFLPISAIKGKIIGKDKDRILAEPGALGIASDLVTFSDDYTEIIGSLLGRTIIMDKLDTAVALAKKYGHQYKIVTLDGDILNTGGSMTGGSVAKKTSNIFGRSREIRSLQEEIEKTEKEAKRLESTMLELEKELENNNNLSLTKKMDLQKLELSLVSDEEDRKKTKTSLLEQEEKLQLYKLEEGQLREQYEATLTEIAIYKEKLEEANKRIEEVNTRISGFQNDLESEKSERNHVLGSITELKIRISNGEQNKVALLENIRRMKTEMNVIKQEEDKMQGEIARNLSGLEDKGRQIEEIKAILTLDREKEKDKQHLLIQGTEGRKALFSEISEKEESYAENMELISKLKNELFRMDTKIEKLTEERQRIYDAMWEEYEVTYQFAKGLEMEDLPYSQLKREVKELKDKIKALGAINVGALEQYKEVKERYEFLTTQKKDIQEAEEKLEGIITELSQRMEERFREQFALISANFNEVFQEMFGGGKAYLKLADEERVLESAIEIIAQPPGKNLQNMLLLSGGERALTAIAILFSILKMKPSPFCILDEIEAALDDANVKRYAQYLTKFSKDTQFIVITHRKGTMESADVLYGITMQEKGVSKLISVNFQETKYA